MHISKIFIKIREEYLRTFSYKNCLSVKFYMYHVEYDIYFTHTHTHILSPEKKCSADKISI